MKRIPKAVTWLCMFSTLYMGCSTTKMIDLSGTETQKTSPWRVRGAMTRDSTMYWLKTSVPVVNDTIRGETESIQRVPDGTLHVSIPLSDVLQIVASHADNITYVVTRTGAEYSFDTAAAIAGDAVVGEAIRIEKAEISIPMGNVLYVHVVDAESVELVALASVVIVGGLLWLVSGLSKNTGEK